MNSKLKLGIVIAFIGLFVGFSSPLLAKKYITAKGDLVKKEFKIKSFDAIDFSSAFDIELTQGNSESIVIEVYENIMEHVVVEVVGGTLKVRTKGNLRNVKTMRAYVSFKMINEIELSGACDLKGMNKFELKDFDLDLSGASEVKLNFDANEVNIESSGASEIKLMGSAGNLEIDISGAAEINTLDLLVDNVILDASGACEAKVYAGKDLRVDASGACSVRYKGSPSVSLDSSGASSIRRY